MRIFVVALSSCLAVLVHASAVTAQDGDSSPRATSEPQERTALRLGHDALKLYEADRFNEAHAQFAAAERLAHSPVFLLYMARCRQKTGKLLEAKTLFARVVAETVPDSAPPTWPRAIEDARSEQTTLLGAIPKVRIAVSGGDDKTVVQIDGKAMESSELGKPVELDPGAHWASARDGSGREVTRTFEVKEGQTEERIDLAFTAATPATPAAARSPEPGKPIAASSGPWRTVGWVTMGVGVIGVGFGAAAGIVAKNETDEIKENCVNDSCLTTDSDKHAEAKRWADWSTVGFIAGGALVAGGVVLVLVNPGGGRPASASGRLSIPERTELRLGLGNVAVRASF